jgi:diaminopimelate dehydrogenase
VEKLRIGIAGYGNLGKGVELAVRQNPDMELVAVFSRRSLGTTPHGAPVVSVGERAKYRDAIDVVILCGGSATDLMEQGPQFAALYHTVDSYDTHARIPEYFSIMDSTAKAAGKVSVISLGWDPGLFSLIRLLAGSILPQGTSYTFWGKGVSQGHSDALRRVPGVKDARQYTVPKQELIDAVRSGHKPLAPGHRAHIRECYVVAEPGADLKKIEAAIKTMPHYFADYETVVKFISEQELQEKHSGLPHGCFVFRTGETSPGVNHVLEFALKLDSNPEFTASVLAAYARATYRLARQKFTGACTIFDIPLAWLSPEPAEKLRKELL